LAADSLMKTDNSIGRLEADDVWQHTLDYFGYERVAGDWMTI